MELEENQEIVLWGWGWEEIGLTLLIHMVLANRTNPLMKKNGRNLMIETILKSLRGKSTWQGIVLAIIVGLLMESNLLINRFAPIVICHFLIKIQQRLSLKLNGEIIALTILNGLIRRMIKTDHNLNIDERKAKYRDHEVICEKNWRHKISKYYCEDCFKEETDDREKNRLQFGIYFDRWTSGNQDIDELIKNRQLNAKNSHAEGGFAKVYSANWIDAYIKGWDQKTNNWKRKERKKVALKVLEDSSRDISRTFLNELEALVKLAELSITGGKLFIVPLYGISQDPDTENFILVFKYIESNFHYYYRTQEFNQLILGTKLTCIWEICMSLGIIHLNNLVHRDFHVGNITYISDFGLCKPAHETNDQKIYGVLPYIAPEVLRGKPYTRASDIYSLGIIINTIISGKLPFDDRSFDRYLIIDICRYGLRPEIRDETPQVLKEIIQKCWDENPENRPTTFDILNQIRFPDNSKLDYKTIEDVYSTFVSLSLDSRSQANYKSRLLDLPDLSELESELAPDSMQISTGEIESVDLRRSRAVSALEAANLVPFNNIHLDIRQDGKPNALIYDQKARIPGIVIFIGSDQWQFQFTNPGNPFKGEYPRIAPFLLTHGCKTTSELLEPYKDKVRRIHTDGFILEEQPNSPALITCPENASKILKALKFETAGYCHVKNANKVIWT
ncbi:kinase-like protein [Rhizophagus irregularis]|uniref:Kinase-like protein n=1 Tax=Rhizophagus irregularis TaxID=588596 RepID=A0A2N1MZW3_9GLOM|nr:kinase-like protein [Rhizophagus irregularis]